MRTSLSSKATPTARSHLAPGLAELGEGEWLLAAIIRGYPAVAQWLRGRLAEAEAALSSSVDGWRAADERYLAAWECHRLGLVQRARVRLDATLGTHQQALEIAAAPGRPYPLPGSWVS